ncbi:hypothetical protein K443DRAFT_129744 [Laccaria amethystina LaAM-08-1]|uniref:Peroxisome membrane anchor protein Pex14p N-terminal domain-containing protein n=1 Tax=Laccaria amethystina LaAM-08-1 TaxID=1095629 RepID=A0A0C9XYQ0_9AGAR|nr:hypothetical protein K443DRAFT_129744 [Laccaria amethystina LaAM-08-1]
MSDADSPKASLTEPPETTPSSPLSNSREELISRARSFLHSPQIQHEDPNSKHRFLAEKGLTDSEIDALLRELPQQAPMIPPRTYPQPPPSNLPNLLLGISRLFSWLAGGSATLIFIYYRFLLPRITKSLMARQSLKAHHLSLLRNLTTSLAGFKEAQSESLSVLPRPSLYQEPARFAACHSVTEVLATMREKSPSIRDIPSVTLLRCAIEDLNNERDERVDESTTEAIFRYLQERIPQLVAEESLGFEPELWETLSTCPLFSRIPVQTSRPVSPQENEGVEVTMRWTYTPPEPTDPSPLLKSLDGLASSLPRGVKLRTSTFQHTLESVSDLTGYLSTQVYLPYRPPPGMVLHNSGNLSPAEEDLRREIRALKGLVLNRRSFMPSIPRPTSQNIT